MPRLRTLTPAHLAICDRTLRSRGLIAPDLALLAAIISTQPRLIANMRYYTTDSPNATLDTYERGYLMDAVAEHYCQEPWPCNGDGMEHMVRFSEILVERASDSGWVFTEPA